MVQAIRAAQPARRLAIRAPNCTVDSWRRGPLIRGALPVRFSVAARNPVAPQAGCVPTQRKVPPMPDCVRAAVAVIMALGRAMTEALLMRLGALTSAKRPRRRQDQHHDRSRRNGR